MQTHSINRQISPAEAAGLGRIRSRTGFFHAGARVRSTIRQDRQGRPALGRIHAVRGDGKLTVYWDCGAVGPALLEEVERVIPDTPNVLRQIEAVYGGAALAGDDHSRTVVQACPDGSVLLSAQAFELLAETLIAHRAAFEAELDTRAAAKAARAFGNGRLLEAAG